MGTRSDFYIGLDPDTMEWLGSIAWDGYPGGIDWDVLGAVTAKAFRVEVSRWLDSREDGTKPGMGWPWPWEDSDLTDFSYAFADGCVWVNYKDRWGKVSEYMEDGPEELESGPRATFPNMKDRQNVNFGKRSGMIFVAVRGIEEE